MTTAASAKKKRPIAVYVIAAFCALQYTGILLAMIKNPDAVSELISINSPLGFAIKFSLPTILFVAGIFLFL